MTMHVQRKFATSLLAATMGVWAGGAVAQTAPPPKAAPEPNANVVQQVVVTAERRSEALQRVPMEVQAFSGAQLRAAGVQKTEDLVRVTPGLEIVTSLDTGSAFLRGVGTNSSAPGEEGGIAFYVDDLYYKDAAGVLTSLANAQSVEVLKGPQGTLYGRNATGGLIHIIYPDPQDRPHAVVRLGYESYNTLIGSFYATGPITNTLDGAVAFDGHYQFDGFGENFTLHRDVDFYRYLNVRPKLLWKPTSQDRITLSASYFVDASASTNTIWPGTVTATGVKPFANPYDVLAATPTSNLVSAFDFSAKWEHDFGNGVVFKSVSAYRQVTEKFIGDVNEPDPSNRIVTNLHKDTWSYQQELLLQGTTKHLNWTTGLFYFTDASKFPLRINLFPHFGTLPTELESEAEHATLISYAAFGQVDWHVTDRDTLTGGLRYTLDRQGSQFVFGLGGLAFGGKTSVQSSQQHASFGQPTWRVAYKHQFTDNFMFWASFSRGFRSGTFNFALNQPPVNPEILDAYEGGFKAALADGRLQVGVNPFYYKYSNLQVQSYQGTTIFLRNAAKAEIYGVEFEATADVPVPVGDLRINVNTAVQHSDFVRFPSCPVTLNPNVAGGVNVNLSCTGNQLQFTPRWTLSVGPDYTVSLPNGGKLDLNLSYYHNTGYFFTVDDVYKQPAFDQLGAEIGYTFPNDRLRLRVYGHNLTDAVVRSSFVNINGFAATNQTTSPPRVFGAEFDYTFN